MPWLASLGTVLVLGPAQPAPPADAPQVGTLPLQVSSDVSELDQEALEQRFTAGIERSGLTSKTISGGCENAECYREQGHREGVSLIAGGTITHEGPDYKVEVYAIDSTSGEVVASVDGVCEICGVGELGDVVGNLAARLRPAVESAIQPTTLTVQSEPSDAEVYVDGELVGTTPLEIPVSSGPHAIDVVKRGRRTEHVDAELRPGVSEKFSFRLARSMRVPPWVPWASLGGGFASLGAGIGLLVIHNEPIRRDCNADVAGNCEFLHDTVAGGVVFTVVGVGLIGTGIGLLITQASRDKQQRAGLAHRPDRRLTLVPSWNGATLVGRF